MKLPPNSRRHRALAGVAALAALGVGGTGIALAQSGGDAKVAYTSSITVPDNGQGEADQAALAGLAKITPEQAKAAALAAVPGTAGQVELESEDGKVVFGVEVTTANGARMDVKVDAGNGEVLAREPDDANEADGEGGADTESTNEAPERAPARAK